MDFSKRSRASLTVVNPEVEAGSCGAVAVAAVAADATTETEAFFAEGGEEEEEDTEGARDEMAAAAAGEAAEGMALLFPEGRERERKRKNE